jgi:hypothetical protein
MVLAAAMLNQTYGYSRVIGVVVSAVASVRTEQEIIVRVDVHTGNNRLEHVTDVQALLVLPETARLISGNNSVFIGSMGPGPADASCNWTMVFVQPGMYTIMVNVSCIDTQLMPRWLMNSTTVEVYDFPHVEFSYHGNTYSNESIAFIADKSYSQAPGGQIISYRWDFGDGTNNVTSEPIVKHAFEKVGNYTVSLNVTDSKGLSNVGTADISISLLADINRDGQINILDISLVAYSVGSHPGNEKWNEQADLNSDNIIDILDISLVATRYGTAA